MKLLPYSCIIGIALACSGNPDDIGSQQQDVCTEATTRDCEGSSACTGQQTCISGVWSACECTGAAGASGAPTGGMGDGGSGGAGGLSGAGGSMSFGGTPECAAIASCAIEVGECNIGVETQGPNCAFAMYGCNGKLGFVTSDNLDFPCLPVAGAEPDCAQASHDAVTHCTPLCDCPAGPLHGFYSCPSGTTACQLYCFSGYVVSGSECVEPPPDPCWATCAQGGYCTNGVCVPCPNPTQLIDCDQKSDNGCEQPFDNAHCGGCGVACDPDQFCSTDGPGQPFSCR
jgi:hypothetical protein